MGFPCVQCKHPIVVLSILAEMDTPRFENEATIDLTCPSCQDRAYYSLSQIRRFEQHQIS